MPTVLRIYGYRFYFFSADCREPAHVHIARGDITAKCWLDPITIADPGRFRRHELNEIVRIVEDHRVYLRTRWHEHCG